MNISDTYEYMTIFNSMRDTFFCMCENSFAVSKIRLENNFQMLNVRYSPYTLADYL